MEGDPRHCPIWSIRVDGTLTAWKFRDLESGREVLWRISGWMGKAYNAGRIGPAVVGIIIKRWFRYCASCTSESDRYKSLAKKRTRVTMPRRRARQPGLMGPRSVNTVPELLRPSTSRRESPLRRLPSVRLCSSLKGPRTGECVGVQSQDQRRA